MRTKDHPHTSHRLHTTLYLAASRVHAIFIEITTRLCHEALDGRREEKPVGIRRIDVAELGKLLQVSLLGYLVQWLPECIVSTEEALGDMAASTRF